MKTKSQILGLTVKRLYSAAKKPSTAKRLYSVAKMPLSGLMAALLLLPILTFPQNTAINEDNSDAHPSAMLDVKSSDKGFLTPRMTTDEIASIDNPANGLIVFSTSDNKFYAYILSEDIWKEIAYGGASQPPEVNLWGMTQIGGINNIGVIFEYNATVATYTKKLEFDGTSTGSNPLGSLMQASNGKLYGMTRQGGTNDLGVLFEYDPATATYTKKLDFDGSSKGRNPFGSLMQVSNGKLYGMTTDGGTNSYGVLFEYDPATGTYTKKLDFDGSTKGSYPRGSLMQAPNSKLYGMTLQGGINGYGVLFEYDPVTTTYTKKLDFDGSTKGRYPNGSLMQASNGKLYGMTFQGGTNNMGVLFEFDPSTATYTKKLDFDGSTKGRGPRGSLIQASNGKLYGMTDDGGINNIGVLFEYDPSTDTFTKKFDFDGANKGRWPHGSLMQASNGKLYGLTRGGGTNDVGVLFEYDPDTETYTKKLDFDGTNGRDPYYTHLIEVVTGGTPAWTCGDILTDPRDSQTYNTVQIGTQCWMAENLNIGTMINGSSNQTNNSTIEKYCYADNTANCDVYGGLYQWDEMMEYVTTEGTQGICPTNWHLPSDAEWTTLTSYLGGESVAGGKLKETGTTHWISPNTGASNSSGFTALPSGYRDLGGTSLRITDYTGFRTSTIIGSNSWNRFLEYDKATVHRYQYSGNTYGFSVRCVMD